MSVVAEERFACSFGMAHALNILGNARPTANPVDRQIKGWMLDDEGDRCKVYFTSTQLRELAKEIIEVADYLDKRDDVGR